VKADIPSTEFTLWRNEHLFDIDFASYTLSHHSFARHFHDYYVIEWVIKGADRFFCNGNTYTAATDQLVLINPGEVHTGSTIADNELAYFSLYPDDHTLRLVAETLDIHLPSHFSFQHTLANNPSLKNKFNLLFDCLRHQYDQLQQEEIFFQCMHELLLQTSTGDEKDILPGKKDVRIKILIDYIRTHFKKDISLTQMAEFVHLNPFHLTRLFKKSTGLSPYEYLLVIRTEYARQLLRKGFKVQDAATKAGFYDASHFNRLFCKTAGASPKFFRQVLS
jgi:AraC-like DNA-binding protein